MNPDMLDSQAQRERILRLIFEPLEGRGEPPRGWSKEQLLADYCLALGRYPEAVLAAAAAKVRAARTRTTWPLAGDYQAACDALMVDESPIGSGLRLHQAAHGSQRPCALAPHPGRRP